MAILTAFFQVDFSALNLNYYISAFQDQEIVLDSDDPTNGSSDDRFSIWTTDMDEAVAFHGRDFDYGDTPLPLASVGTVEAFSEWYWDLDTYTLTRIYVLEDINVDMSAFYDALVSESTVDDFALLRMSLAGNDTITLSGFDDTAYGYRGSDIMKGGSGNDRLYAGSGNDTLEGNDGNDILMGAKGNDIIWGGIGNDRLEGGKGMDRLYGGRGHDKLEGGEDNDFLNGGNGRDIVRGGAGNDRLKGNAHNDVLHGGTGRDKMIGGDGDDRFVFRTGDEVDIVKDWGAGDIIDLRDLETVTSWADLTENHMTQKGNHVVIDGGNGDVLTLRTTDLNTLAEADFLFADESLLA